MLQKQPVEGKRPTGIATGRRREDIDEADRRGPDAILHHTREQLQGFLGTPGLDVPAGKGVPRDGVPLGHRVEQPADDVDAAAAAAVPHAGGVDVEERVAEHRGVGQCARAAEEVRVDGLAEAEAAGACAGGERAGVGVVVGARRGARGVVEERVEAQRVVRQRAGHVGDEDRVAEQRRRRARERFQQQPPRAVELALLAQPPHLRRHRMRLRRLLPAPAATGAGGGGIGGGDRERDGAAGRRMRHGTVARRGDSPTQWQQLPAHRLIPFVCFVPGPAEQRVSR